MGSPILQKRGRHVQDRRRRHLAKLLPIGLVVACFVAPQWGAACTEYLQPVEQASTPLFAYPSPIGDLSYTAGRGLRVGDTGFTLGGYSSVNLTRNEGDRAQIELDDLSFFIIGDPLPRVHFFAELEYEDAVTIDERGNASSPDDVYSAERLYTDVAVTDALNVRTGIFLTPVGRWNTIHAAPLVWTTSRPLTTEKPFDPNLTGVMILGSVFPGSNTLTYFLWDQFAPPIEGNPEFDPADHSLGGRLQLDTDASWSVGASVLAARRGGGWRQLGGLDFLWTHRRVEIMGELIVADGGGIKSEGGGYLQAAVALTPRLALIERYEHYAAPAPAPSVNLVALGFAFRPLPAIVLKVEYLVADRRAPDAEPGFKASMATLF